MLALEIEFLTGVSVAATPNTRERAEWPPHPDRLFQALVAAWGRNDQPDEMEQAALEWFERLPTDGLVISAPKAHRRDVVTVYVPPNDARTTGKPGDKSPGALAPAVRVVPELRRNRQPRAFPAVVPAAERAIVRYIWPFAPALERHRDALSRLAREVTYLGHSHSLVRVALVEATSGDESNDIDWVDDEGSTLRLPYAGRLEHLRDRHQQTLEREDGRIVRPNPSLVTRTFRAPVEVFPQTHFDPDNVTVLSDDGGFVPSLEAFPLVAKRLRDALLVLAPKGAAIPKLLSGHDADRRPTADPHIAVVPLADVGWKHSQGRLMGLALVWPRDADSEQRKAALKVLATFLPSGAGEVPLLGSKRDPSGTLHFGGDGSWRIALDPEPDRASLRFGRYTRASRRWATVLPAVLDRHPKDKPGGSITEIVKQACRNVGLRSDHKAMDWAAASDGLEVDLHKYSAVMGAPSVKEVSRALPQDSRYRNMPLCHLVLTFPRAICGPLLLGAGRFRGLGLCLPIDDGASL